MQYCFPATQHASNRVEVETQDSRQIGVSPTKLSAEYLRYWPARAGSRRATARSPLWQDRRRPDLSSNSLSLHLSSSYFLPGSVCPQGSVGHNLQGPHSRHLNKRAIYPFTTDLVPCMLFLRRRRLKLDLRLRSMMMQLCGMKRCRLIGAFSSIFLFVQQRGADISWVWCPAEGSPSTNGSDVAIISGHSWLNA